MAANTFLSLASAALRLSAVPSPVATAAHPGRSLGYAQRVGVAFPGAY